MHYAMAQDYISNGLCPPLRIFIFVISHYIINTFSLNTTLLQKSYNLNLYLIHIVFPLAALPL